MTAVHYAIRHETLYRYRRDVAHAHQQLHLTPRNSERQHCVLHRIDITPQPAVSAEYVDAFGNWVTRVELDRPHNRLQVVAEMDVRLDAQPEVRLATCFVAFDLCPAGTNYGDIRKTDLTLGWNYNAPGSYNATFAAPRNTGMVSLSYVTGAHNMKVGWVQGWGYRKIDTPMNNAGLTQRYRLGVPDSVVLSVVPSFQDTTINPDLGLYIQDTWTRGRFTVNPGLRYDYIHGTILPVDGGWLGR